MATETTNYSLTKPDESDYYDIADFNDNMDVIDETMAQNATSLNNAGDTLNQIVEYIGTPESEGNTLFNQLGNSEVYHASENYKYDHDYGNGISYSSYQVLWQFTARRSGSIFVTIDVLSSTSQTYFSIYETHPGAMYGVPTGTRMSPTHSTAVGTGSSKLTYSYYTSTGSITISHMLNVSPGHTYALVSAGSGTVYSCKIGYDIVNPLDLTETDLDPYVDSDSSSESE